MSHELPISFGKYKGTPISAVPVDYLVWVLDSFRNPPIAVVAELERRGSEMSGGAAFLAQAALGKWKHKKAAKGSRSRKARVRREHRLACSRDVQRQIAGEKTRALGRGVRITGSDFEEKRDEWERDGGDPSACPFGDSDDVAAMQHLRSIASGG